MNAGGENQRRGKRPGAELDGNPSKTIQTDRIRVRSVLMESAVHIDDLKNLKFEGQSLSTVFTERGWTGILEPKGKVYEDIVYDFYERLGNSNLVAIKLSVSVRQVEVVFSPMEIASFLYLPRKHPNPRSSHERHVDDIYRALTGTDQHDDVNRVISVKDMLPFFQMLHLIVAANIRPTNQTTDHVISIEQGKFLLDIAHGVNIDLPLLIFKTIIESATDSRSSKDCLPFGRLITGLWLKAAMKAGVRPRSNEKEVEPVDPIHIDHWTQEAVGTTASLSQSTVLPPTPGFGAMSLENMIKSRVIAELQVAPIQRKLKDMDSRLKTVEDWLRSKL